MARGRYAEARAVLEPAAKGRALEARYQLGLLYHELGEAKLERAVWNGFYDDYEHGRIDKKSAAELTYVARAAQRLGGWKDANDTFRDAVGADPKGKAGALANIAWARLFLEKYDAGHAEACLADALKVLPNDAEAHTLYAAVKLEQSYDIPAALRELDLAERAQKGLPEARALRGKIFLEDEERDRAVGVAKALLADNPEDVAARTILAGAALLADDRAGYEAQRARVLASHPRAGRFFHELGELLVREHRYGDAIALEEEALRVDDRDPVARAAYGANLLRLGREDEGLQALREAWRKDKYNVRTYNLLQLFEEVIPKGYAMLEAPPFRLRVPIAERAVLEATLVPLLRRAERALTALYGFAPKGPITVELYTDPQHYAVRTIGLPGLDAIGVTFGPLITAMSPSLGKFNWGMVLWHELAHVYAIEASRSRVPRWFTEGLSEYETTVADPLWTRRTSAELAAALQRGELLPVERLNRAFVRARNLPQMVVAYHEAAAAVRYFIERAGRPAVVVALRRFGEGKTFADVVREATGEALPAFDAAFRRWLGERLRGYDGQLIVRPADYADVETLEARVKAAPTDGRARGLLALARAAAGQLDEARRLLDEAKGAAAAPEAAYAAARLALLAQQPADAEALVARLRAMGARGADVELLDARVRKAKGDVDGAWQHLQRAADADPDRAEPHLLMAELAAGKPAPAACAEATSRCELDALARALEREVMDASIGKRLFARRAAAKLPVEEAVRRTLDVAPFDGALRVALAADRLARGDRAGAVAELGRARACPLDAAATAAAQALEQRLAAAHR